MESTTIKSELILKNAILIITVAAYIIAAGVVIYLLGTSIVTPVYLGIFAIVAVAAYFDIKEKIIPNELIFAGIALALIIFPINPLTNIIQSFLGALIVGGGLACISIFTKGQIGMGDAKLFICLGLFLGLKASIVILFYSMIAGAAVGLVMITFKHAKRKTTIPFAPFVFIGVFVEFLIKF